MMGKKVRKEDQGRVVFIWVRDRVFSLRGLFGGEETRREGRGHTQESKLKCIDIFQSVLTFFFLLKFYLVQTDLLTVYYCINIS